ncbi:MAG: OmpH family outer membrane protein [Bacteroidales bacterium]|nr:OmpH family outer membrane protein [Bacteroidales bacterium]
MKRVSIYLLLVALVVTLTNSYAQKSPKLGHINSQELLAAMPETDSAQAKIQRIAKEFEDQLEIMQVEFNNKYQKYLQEQKNYTDLVRKAKENELQDLQQRIQEFQYTAQEEIENQRNELFQPIIDKAQKAVKDVARENGFTYVFDTGTGAVVYWAEDSEDLMAKVKAKLGVK